MKHPLSNDYLDEAAVGPSFHRLRDCIRFRPTRRKRRPSSAHSGGVRHVRPSDLAAPCESALLPRSLQPSPSLVGGGGGDPPGVKGGQASRPSPFRNGIPVKRDGSSTCGHPRTPVRGRAPGSKLAESVGKTLCRDRFFLAPGQGNESRRSGQGHRLGKAADCESRSAGALSDSPFDSGNLGTARETAKRLSKSP
jgi:hypothetical protein